MLNARIKRGAIAIPATAALVAMGLAAVAVEAQASPPARTALAGSRPFFAKKSADRGAVSTSARQNTRIYLASRNAKGLTAYATAVSTPGGSEYGKYLSASQTRARFGPSAAEIARVRAWVASVGLKVTSETPQYIEVTGTVGVTEKAFDVSIHKYATSAGVIHGITSNIKIPTSLAHSILGVSGISGQVYYDHPSLVKQSSVLKALGAKPDNGTVNPVCSAYYDQSNSGGTGLPPGYNSASAIPYSECSWVPSQLREAYGVSPSGLTGKGVTVAIVDAYASPTMPADANQFATNHGDSAFANGQFSQTYNAADWTLVGNGPGECGDWTPEESLDIEQVHGMAPDANIEYIGANSCDDDDLLAAIASVVDAKSANIISDSWGEIMHSTLGTGPDGDTISPQEIAAYEQVFKLAAVEGIGVQFSAGDCGDSSPASAATGANCDPTTTEPQANWPDSDPWATSVGGTALFTSTPGGKYDFESTMGDLLSFPTATGTDITAWNPFPGEFYFGGGGGTSQDFAQPSYQVGVVPDSLSHTLMTGAHSNTAQRVTPDVSMQGDLINATLVGLTDANDRPPTATYCEGGFGGTSVSSPEWAGMMADADQALGHAAGFENPLIYDAYGKGVFNDIVANPPEAHGGTHGVLQEILDFGAPNELLAELGQDSTLVATHGYDNATGVGSGSLKFLDLMMGMKKKH